LAARRFGARAFLAGSLTMQDRELGVAQEPARRGPTPSEGTGHAAQGVGVLSPVLAGLAAAPEAILALQRSAGNCAVTRLLARREAPGASGDPAQQAQEAEAAQTYGLARDAYSEMLDHADDRIRNTARLLDPPGERSQGRRVRVEPMTLRSDSAKLVAERHLERAHVVFCFLGPRQDNTEQISAGVMGQTRGGGVVYLRGRDEDGRWRSKRDVIATLVHEVKHALDRDYGDDLPSLLARYGREFRAHWITPFTDTDALTDPDERARAIKYKLVGYSSDDTTSYVDLRDAYWQEPHDRNVFRGQVDRHMRPDGFNLTNSPLLDGLVQGLRDLRAGRASVDDVIWRVTLLAPGERQEVAGAPLIRTLLAGLAPLDAERIRRALTAPAAVGYGRELNPTESPRVTGFLEAVVDGSPDAIGAAYERCSATERAQLRDARVLAWLREIVRDPLARACTVGMLSSGSRTQFGAVRAFLDAAGAALGATSMPAALRSALGAMTIESRLAFVALSHDASRRVVTPLAEPLRTTVEAVLRGDRSL
jgi:hypothetical protein